MYAAGADLTHLDTAIGGNITSQLRLLMLRLALGP